MILASHGIIASSISGVDADWLAYYNRVVTAGGSLTTTEQNATKTLVADMKAAGLWSGMKAVYPMVGASAAACAQNLKSASFTGTFSSGWTFASTGISCGGSSFMNTFLTPSTDLSLNNTHLSVYVRTNNAQSNPAIGNTDNGSGNNELSIYPRYTGDNVYIRINASSSPITTSANSQGMHIGSRIVSEQIKYYKNSSSFSLSNNSSSLTTGTMPLGAFRYLGTTVTYYTGEFAFCSIGDGLTDTQAGNFYTAVQAFQTTLSRQV